ncbi:MAG: hypothetical protein ACLTBV_14030 [Enterocloster bolteae]
MTSGSLYFKLLKEDFRRRLWAIALVFLAFFFTLPIGLALNMENAANSKYYECTMIMSPLSGRCHDRPSVARQGFWN